MKHPCLFSEHALEDVAHHYVYYEKIQAGLGDRFMFELTQATKEISSLPKGYQKGKKNTRQRKLKHFPHQVIYSFESGTIYIHAVFAIKQSPGKKYKNL